MNKRILIVVEGEVVEKTLMTRILSIYGISGNHTIVTYKTNIYGLYEYLERCYNCFSGNKSDKEAIDILQVLKEREKDTEKKKLFDNRYTDILLIFDLDPQDPKFTADKILHLMEYFNNSTECGKLYINYPMVESFYHLASIPDPNFNNLYARINELGRGQYKNLVKNVFRRGLKLNYSTNPPQDFPRDKKDSDIIIGQNLNKAAWMAGQNTNGGIVRPDDKAILEKQLEQMNQDKRIYVLCTCVFYIYDYNPALIDISALN